MEIAKLLQNVDPSTSPAQFLAWVAETEFQKKETYFLFTGNVGYQQFCQSLEYLQTEATLALKDLETAALVFVAQTIDGDYLFSSPSSTLVIPTSLQKKDCESFEKTIVPFLLDYYQGNIQSTILQQV